MSLWSVIGNRIFSGGRAARLSEDEMRRLEDVAMSDDVMKIREALTGLAPEDVRELARSVLRKRMGEAIELLRSCRSCHDLLSGRGYDPVLMLETFRERVGRRGAQMDIDESGGGGSQRGQGFNTRIRFGPLNFLTGLSLDGMTLHESQLQVILHELAHAAGDVIPPDGGNPQESVRNQHRITSACLPETYERIGQEFGV